jgi:hypothetical protein
MKRNALAAIFLMSVSLIGLELVWTRLFSAEFFYTFAFLTLSLAVMGLGFGALAVRLFAFLSGERWLGWSLFGAAAAALAGPPLVFRLGLDFTLLFSSWAMIGRLAAAIAILSAPFFFGGVALAKYFRGDHPHLPVLYMADLVGAGVGVVLAVVLMNGVGTQVTAFWVSLPLVVAAFLAGRSWTKVLPLALVVALVVAGGSAGTLLEASREERAPVVYKHWDAMAKIKVYDFGGRYRGINIDNVANTPLIPFDGDWDAWYADSTNSQWDIDVGYLVGLFDHCTFLSLGSGGGMDVLQALDKGAEEVHAVEVIPQINKMLLEGDPSGYVTLDSTVTDSTGRLITTPEFTGYLYRDPRVKVVTEDARTYVRRNPQKFDVIYSLSSNTWAALGSGSFALAENYIFTTEAFEDYWNALTPGGFLSMEHQVYVPRLVSEVIDALEALGVENPRDHFAVYDLPRMRRKLILLSKRPLTDEIRYNAYQPLTPERYEHIHLLYPAPDSLQDNLVNQIVSNGWRAEVDSADIDLSPATDDRPFIAHMGLWNNLTKESVQKVSQYAEFRGFPMSNLIIAIILAVVVVLALPLCFLPYAFGGERLRLVPWLYFAFIGAAFMIVEVVLIQRYALFIGASSYSIAVVLFTLLVASGVGSRFANRVGGGTAFAGIAAWLLLEIFVFRPLTNGLSQLPLPARVVTSAVLVFPLGFFMGMPFPKAGLRVKELIDWGFAVNGVASVLGATAAVALAFTLGLRNTLAIALLLYLAAFALLRTKARWSQ